MATAADVASVRTWVGNTPVDGDIEDALDAGASPHDVALAILQTRRADLIAAGPSLSVSGHGSRGSAADLIKALDYDIDQLLVIVSGSDTGIVVAQFSRSDLRRGCR